MYFTLLIAGYTLCLGHIISLEMVSFLLFFGVNAGKMARNCRKTLDVSRITCFLITFDWYMICCSFKGNWGRAHTETCLSLVSIDQCHNWWAYIYGIRVTTKVKGMYIYGSNMHIYVCCWSMNGDMVSQET